MNTRIIAAFPGVGKSYFAATSDNNMAIDLDSNDYTLGYKDDGTTNNLNFPDNYVTAVKEHIGRAGILLVACQPEVITALHNEKITFTLIYPERSLRTEYLNRFRQRGDSSAFTNMLSAKWDLFLDFLEKQQGCGHIVLASGQYISDVIADS